jgi:hypothetical protein
MVHAVMMHADDAAADNHSARRVIFMATPPCARAVEGKSMRAPFPYL